MPDRDFLPTASLAALRRRASRLQQLRQFFLDRDFLEVDTPLLSADCVVDRYLDPLEVTLFDDPSAPSRGRRMWLQTSPEFAMKRLLAAGAERIFQVTHAFRAGERGPRHNPEFTMVEWYRVGDSMRQGIDLLAELAGHFFGVREVERISYREAFEAALAIDPLAVPTDQLARLAQARTALGDVSSCDRDGLLNVLLAEVVEPGLGRTRPAVLYDFPASQAALARVREETPPVAERFELYVNGVELANGYHELTDADVLRARNGQTNDARRRDGKFTLPETSRLLDAMQEGLPECCGVALGFDRLVMLLEKAASIEDVLAFPVERA